MSENCLCGLLALTMRRSCGTRLLAAVFSGERMNHVCPFGKVMISYSEDERESWTLPATLLDTPLDESDAGICVCGGNRIKTEESLSSLFLQNNQKVQ